MISWAAPNLTLWLPANNTLPKAKAGQERPEVPQGYGVAHGMGLCIAHTHEVIVPPFQEHAGMAVPEPSILPPCLSIRYPDDLISTSLIALMFGLKGRVLCS